MKCSQFAGSSEGFGLALILVILWAISGPAFEFSSTWQMGINTATTIVTFLMVFLIQRSQNKDVAALHAKLNELIASKDGASNRLINIEDGDEQSLEEIKHHYQHLSGSDDATTGIKSIADSVVGT